MKKLSLLVWAMCVGFTDAEEAFLEKKGIVMMEAESTSSSLGSWEKKTDVEGYSGECHLEFIGNKITNGPPKSPLKYEFLIEKGGVYSLLIRARKRLETEREDLSNDCYVSLKGDFDEAGGAPIKILKEDTKLFGGDKDGWGWAKKLDANHKKFAPLYLLKSGEKYTLTIHGRSKNFNMDQILFLHESHKIQQILSKLPEESERMNAELKQEKVVERELTNIKGKKINARLLSKSNDSVSVSVKGRVYELELKTLSKDDQEFIREWEP